MMNKVLILGALPAVFAGAHGKPQTTKTVYSTQVHTVTSCGPTVTNCPAKGGPVIVTEIVPVSTTVCDVTSEKETWTQKPTDSCKTTTAYSDCVHTITKTAEAFKATTSTAYTTVTKKETITSASTCVHTIGEKDKMTVTTVIPTTITKTGYETKYTTKVVTITGATTHVVVTTKVPTTAIVCPAKPTWSAKPDHDHDYDHDYDHDHVKPTGSWGKPEKPEHDYDHVKPTGTYGKPEYSSALPAKPTGTGSYTKTHDGSKAVVTAGASAFGAQSAIKMLGAAAAAALLL